FFMIPGGVLADRFGAPRSLASGLAFFSVFTVLTPLLPRLAATAACRFLVGAGQGLNFPSINNLIATHVPLTDRAKVQGFVLSGMTIGAVIALPVGSWIVQRWGWPAIFYAFGLAGFVWIGPWLRYATRLQGRGGPAASPATGAIPWRAFLTHRSSLGLTLSYYCHNYASYFILTWLPTYLIQEHGFSMTGMGIGAALPALAATASMNASGLYTDHLIAGGRSREFALKLMVGAGMGVSGVLLLALLWTEDPYLAVFWIVLSSAAKSLATPAYWTLSMEMAPRHAGILSSIMNTSGNLAGVVAPALSGYLVASRGWNAALAVCAAITLVGVAIALPTVRAVEITAALKAGPQRS
ncbi:MAG: MFS transporter, partial [Proteobacteria bacterium]|nr:MFS transporter [Pseudomonadota bacterium]